MDLHFFLFAELDEALGKGVHLRDQIIVYFFHIQEDGLGGQAVSPPEQILDAKVHGLRVVDRQLIQDLEHRIHLLGLVPVGSLLILSETEQLGQPHHERFHRDRLYDAHEGTSELFTALERRNKGENRSKEQLGLIRLVPQGIGQGSNGQFCPLHVSIRLKGINAQHHPITPKRHQILIIISDSIHKQSICLRVQSTVNKNLSPQPSDLLSLRLDQLLIAGGRLPIFLGDPV